MVQAVQNLGLSVVTLLVGWMVENLGYYWLEVFNAGCLVAAILGSLALLWSSKAQHMGYLHMRTKQRNYFETTKEYFAMMKKVSGEAANVTVENPNYQDQPDTQTVY